MGKAEFCRDDGHVLKRDCSESCTTLYIYQKSLNCTLTKKDGMEYKTAGLYFSKTVDIMNHERRRNYVRLEETKKA